MAMPDFPPTLKSQIPGKIIRAIPGGMSAWLAAVGEHDTGSDIGGSCRYLPERSLLRGLLAILYHWKQT